MGDDGVVAAGEHRVHGHHGYGWSWAAGAFAFVVALLGTLTAGAAVGDWYLQNQEMGRLLTAVEASESAMGQTSVDVMAAFERNLDAPSLVPALTDIALDGQVRVSIAGDGVAEVGILPWHRRIEDARSAYLAHNQAWQDYLARAVLDPIVFSEPQPAVDETFLASEPLMKRAVPLPAFPALVARVAAIYTEGAAADRQSA